jgi:hypothetical protein
MTMAASPFAGQTTAGMSEGIVREYLRLLTKLVRSRNIVGMGWRRRDPSLE